MTLTFGLDPDSVKANERAKSKISRSKTT